MIKLLICGDFGYRGRTAEDISLHNGINLFKEFESVLQKADYSMLNLESPVGNSSQFVKKCGPSLFTTEKSIKVIKKAGFNGVTLANNHFFDCGQNGVEQTIRACENNDLDYFGGGINKDHAEINRTISIKKHNTSIINVCENEFSIANSKHGGSKHLDPIQQFNEIQSAIKRNEIVVIVVHGGHEYYQLPSPRMQETYRFFIDAGASAVINHHQHCFSGYEIYKGKPIFYGLGNFCFDSARGLRDNIWNQGYAVMLNIDCKFIGYELFPYMQSNEQAGIRLLNKNEEASFYKQLHNLNRIIEDKDNLSSEFDRFCKTHDYTHVLSPFYNGLTCKLYKYNWFPSFVSLKHRYLQLHYLQCESHRDVMLNNLNNIINKQ